MPKVNTFNYDTIASWNGSEDLFVVEQPDGTKVATPAMVKQYVLADVTETSEQYAECSTARNVTAKTVTLPRFKLEAGARISVRFTNTGSSNPASGNITLNVNGTGDKEIVDGHTNKTKLSYTSGGLFYNNQVIDFIYDGTYWVYMNRDNNTTYSSKTAASGGTATSLCTTGEKYTWNNKQNALTFDDAPTASSNNPVKSGGIFTSLAGKADVYISSSNGTSQDITVGTNTSENRMFLLSVGYPSTYVFGLIFVTYDGTCRYINVSNNQLTVSNASYSSGVVTLSLSTTPYTKSRLIRLC